ncbi:hypothetical protein [Nonomuraea sp. NPDC005692]|uniref:hypothetical protein n=1 Tax=Nonomuraea sp. NPDC005692 TaxID=3157168 RepID=UPI0033F2CECC
MASSCGPDGPGCGPGLEQGQSPNVSDDVLDAVARVLRLDDDELAHLHRLARAARAGAKARPEQLRPGIRLMVDASTDRPATTSPAWRAP